MSRFSAGVVCCHAAEVLDEAVGRGRLPSGDLTLFDQAPKLLFTMDETVFQSIKDRRLLHKESEHPAGRLEGNPINHLNAVLFRLEQMLMPPGFHGSLNLLFNDQPRMFDGSNLVLDLLDDPVRLDLEGDAAPSDHNVRRMLENQSQTRVADALDVEGAQEERKERFNVAGKPELVLEFSHEGRVRK